MSRKGLLLAASALAVLAVAILSVREIRRRQALADLPDVPTANVPASIVRALTPLRAAVVEQPRSGSAWGVYGMALYANEFFGPAAPCFARAEELNGGDARWPHLWSLCQFGEARRLRGAALRRALAADPGQA
ncbi:MAG TPA: hypothetical protein VNC50_03370, partial [Planctomycetia bacterium]|nr:hypothetical protein [Planctomycetia bacterium]